MNLLIFDRMIEMKSTNISQVDFRIFFAGSICAQDFDLHVCYISLCENPADLALCSEYTQISLSPF